MSNQKNVEKALLVMDIQNAIVSRLEKPEAILEPINKAIATARNAGIKVIFVKLGFRQGYPEIADNHPLFGPLKQTQVVFTEDHESSAFAAGISVEPEDIIVTKKRVSAFAGSDLDIILRSNGIKSLLLAGISTSGVVLSTLREASDKDYQVTVLTDACADPDPAVHTLLVDKVFPFSGATSTTADWASSL